MRSTHGNNGIYRAARRKFGGFTVAELLLVVALLLIVGAVGLVGGMAAVRSTRQTSLDHMAETLYAAAQNQLTQRFAFGSKAALREGDGIVTVSSAPADYIGTYPAEPDRQLRSIRCTPGGNAASENAAAELLFPAGTLPDDMRHMNWVVEYDPVSCVVYSVFYSESFSESAGYREFYGDGAELDTNALRGASAERRSLTNARVGYYAGQTPGLPEHEIGDLSCAVSVTNGEKLYADFTCMAPSAFDGDIESIRFDIGLRGVESGHELAFSVSTGDTDGVSVPGPGGREYAYRLVLDSLEDGASFAENFCTPNERYGVSADNALVPGEDISVTLTVSGECRTAGRELPPVGDEAAVNSLFAYDADADRSLSRPGAVLPVITDEDGRYLARIACARHLQNLDSASGVSPIPMGEGYTDGVAALQQNDVDFTEGAWEAAYPGRSFRPVENTALCVYDGGGYVIRGLYEEQNESSSVAGLFGIFAGRISDLTLIDPVIHGLPGMTKAAGGFVGDAFGDVSLVRCGLYMQDELDVASAAEASWLSGADSAGGLVGHAEGSVTAEDCFAATVIRASAGGVSGGLVGRAEGAVLAIRSYADCYLGGHTVGGLVGACGEGSGFVSCYSAGFVLGAPEVAAGYTPDAAALAGGASLFNFDDITARVFDTLTYDGDGNVDRYPKTDETGTAKTKIALSGPGSTGSGWYTYYDEDIFAPEDVRFVEIGELFGELGYKPDDLTRIHPYKLARCFATQPAMDRTPAFVNSEHYGDWLERPRNGELYARIYHAPWGDVNLVFEYGPAQEDSPFGTPVNGAEWRGDETFLTQNYGRADAVPWYAWHDVIDHVAFRIEDGQRSVRPVSTAYWFADFGDLTQIGDAEADGGVSSRLTKLDTSVATDMSMMFSGCRRLESLDVRRLGGAAVRDASYMFADCESLTGLELNSFSANQCRSMRGMFSGCGSLSGLGLSGMTTSSVRDMGEMFSDCRSLERLDLSGFDTSGATDMYAMFYRCSALEQLDLSGFATGRVTDMRFMFEYCTALEQLDLSGLRTNSVTDMRNMFSECVSLTRLDLGSFDTAAVTNMSEMFYGCSALKSVELGSFDVSAVTTMHGMFSGCSSLRSADMSSFAPGSADIMTEMFYGCSALEHIYATDAFDMSGVSAHEGMFTDCISLRGGSGTRFDPAHTDGAYAKLDGGEAAPGYFTMAGTMYARIYEDGGEYALVIERGDPESAFGTPVPDCEWNGAVEGGFLTAVYTESSLPPWLGAGLPIRRVIIDVGGGYTVTPVSTAYWFFGLSRLEEVKGLDAVSTAGVTDMGHMFYGCSSLTSLDLNGFVTGSAKDMSYMFAGCSSLAELDLGGFNTAAATDMSGMFSGCSRLSELDVGGFRTANVESMRGMFRGCAALTTLSLDAFDTSSVTDMAEMFADCGALEKITVTSAFRTDAVTESTDMFRGCFELCGLNGTAYDGDHVDAAYAVIDGESGEPGYLSAELYAVLHTDGTLVFRLGGAPDEGKTAEGIYLAHPYATYFEDDLPAWLADGRAERICEVRFASAARPESTAYWFYGCTALQTAELDGLDMSGVISAEGMFSGCTALERIYVPAGYSASGVSASLGMFEGCVLLTGGGDTVYDPAHTDASYAVIGTEAKPGYFTDIAERDIEPQEPDGEPLPAEEPAGEEAPEVTDAEPAEEAITDEETARTPVGSRFERGVIVDDGMEIGVLDAQYMPETYYDGDWFYSDEEGTVLRGLYGLTGSWRPDEGQTYILSYGDEDVLLYAQFWHTNGPDGETLSEFWRFVCTRPDGTLLLTADENGAIEYEEEKDVDLNTRTMRLYSDDDRTVEVTNLTALIGPREAWPELGGWAEFDAWVSGVGWQKLRVETSIDEDGDLCFSCRWNGEEIFRAWLVGDGELHYSHSGSDPLWYDSYYYVEEELVYEEPYEEPGSEPVETVTEPGPEQTVTEPEQPDEAGSTSDEAAG